MTDRELGDDAAYWRERLRGAPVVELPCERPPAADVRRTRAEVTIPLPASAHRPLRELAAAEDVRIGDVLAVAWAVVLGRHAMQDDVVIGLGTTTSAAAPWPLRAGLSRHSTARQLIGTVREQAAAADRHGMAPWALAAALAGEGAVPVIPFTTAVIDGNAPSMDLDLLIKVNEHVDGVRATIDHATARMGRAAVERIAKEIAVVVQAMVANPVIAPRHMPILDREDEEELLALSSGPRFDDPYVRVDAMFRATASRQPDWPALQHGDRTVSYGTIADRANRLARWLARRVGTESAVIALVFDRSPEFVIAQLAVWTAGHACVPIDAKVPADRRARMVLDSRAALLLYSESVLGQIGDLPCPAVALETLAGELAIESAEPLSCETSPNAAAYVIFTSGSTGAPKGVVVPHAGLSNFLQNDRRLVKITPRDRFPQTMSIGADASIQSFWSFLTAGATVIIVDDEILLSPPAFKQWMRVQEITICGLPSSLFEALVDGDWTGMKLRYVGTGLEKLHKLEAKLPFVLAHGYGPTECTIGCTKIVGFTEFPPPIGRPSQNVRVYVLDGELQLAPRGALGEGYVAGICVARGYLRADLSAERFLPDPFGPAGSRMYKTGDVLRFRDDGNLEFCGRADRQIKLRGFRVEPGEIESAIRAEPEVSEVVVVAVGDQARPDRLIAYVVPSKPMTTEVLSAALKGSLASRLPPYMIPSSFVVLERIPLTPIGKVDHKALPDPLAARSHRSPETVAPRTPTEQAVADVYGEVLGAAFVGVHDDFFALGGHSLVAHRVAARLRERLGVRIAERILFEAPTVEKLAARIDDLGRGVTGPLLERVEERHRAPLSFNQLMWWRRQQHRPDSPGFNYVAAFRLHGALDVAAFAQSIDEEVRRHDAFRTTIEVVDGQPVQVVSAARTGVLAQRDLSSAGADALGAFLDEENDRRAELVGRPLLRFTLLRIADDEHAFVLAGHRIILDTPLYAAVLAEVLAIYDARVCDEPSPLAEPPYQYVDFVAWQRKLLDEPDLRERIGRARRHLAGATALALPFDRPAPATQTTQVHAKPIATDEKVWSALRDLARAEATTQFVVQLAAFNAFLSLLARQHDIVVVAPNELARGLDPGLSAVFGCFSDYFVLRTDLSGTKTLRDVVRRIHGVAVDAQKNVDVPCMTVTDDYLDGALWRVVLNAMPAPDSSALVSTTGLTVASVPVRAHRMVDLAWALFGLRGFFFGSSDKLDPDTTAQLARHFGRFLGHVVSAPDATFTDVYEASRAT